MLPRKVAKALDLVGVVNNSLSSSSGEGRKPVVNEGGSNNDFLTADNSAAASIPPVRVDSLSSSPIVGSSAKQQYKRVKVRNVILSSTDAGFLHLFVNTGERKMC